MEASAEEGLRHLKLKPRQSQTSLKRFLDEMEGAKDLKPKILLQIPAQDSAGSLIADENRDADINYAELWQRPKESLRKEVTCRTQAWLTADASSIC